MNEPARTVDFREENELVGLAVAVAVDAADDAAAIGVVAERTVLVDAHENFAIRRASQTRWVTDVLATATQCNEVSFWVSRIWAKCESIGGLDPDIKSLLDWRSTDPVRV